MNKLIIVAVMDGDQKHFGGDAHSHNPWTVNNKSTVVLDLNDAHGQHQSRPGGQRGDGRRNSDRIHETLQFAQFSLKSNQGGKTRQLFKPDMQRIGPTRPHLGKIQQHLRPHIRLTALQRRGKGDLE